MNYVKRQFLTVCHLICMYIRFLFLPSSFPSFTHLCQSRFGLHHSSWESFFREWVDTLPISRLRLNSFLLDLFFFCYYSRVVVTHHDYIRHFRSNRSRSKISQNHYEFTNFTFSLSRKSHVLFPFDLRGCTTPTNYHDFDDRSNPSCLHGPAELHTNPQKRVTALPHTFIIHRAWTRKKRN